MTVIRPMTRDDWHGVEAVYAAGIAGGEATFETHTPTWEAFDAGRVADSRLVAVDDAGGIVGWAAASPVSPRGAYQGVVEHSVYIRPDGRGGGIGRDLLDAFLAATDIAGYWTVQASLFPENAASLRLHARAGFRVVGRRERISVSRLGPHAGQWRDTVLVERRSPLVGRASG